MNSDISDQFQSDTVSVDNIPVVRRVSNEPSQYNIIGGNELNINPDELMDGVSYAELFANRVQCSAKAKEQIEEWSQEYERQNQSKPELIVVPTDEKSTLFTVYFENSFKNWLQKHIAATGFKYYLLPSTDIFLKGLLRKLSGEDGGSMPFEAQYQAVGSIDKERFELLAEKFKQSNGAFLVTERFLDQVKKRREFHEFAHHNQMEIFLGGGLRKIFIEHIFPLLEKRNDLIRARLELLQQTSPDALYSVAAENWTENAAIKNCVDMIMFIAGELQGLFEAHSIVAELAQNAKTSEPTRVVDPTTELASDFFRLRLAILLSHFNSDWALAYEIDNMLGHNPAQLIESHDLGTLIVLTQGKILETSSEYELTSVTQLGKTSEEVVDNILEMLDKAASSENIFADLPPDKLIQVINNAMQKGLASLLDLFTNLYTIEGIDSLLPGVRLNLADISGKIEINS